MDVTGWIERYRRAWQEADADAVVELFTTNASYRSNIFREPHVGRTAIHAYLEEATATQVEIDVRVRRPGRSGRPGLRRVVDDDERD